MRRTSAPARAFVTIYAARAVAKLMSIRSGWPSAAARSPAASARRYACVIGSTKSRRSRGSCEPASGNLAEGRDVDIVVEGRCCHDRAALLPPWKPSITFSAVAVMKISPPRQRPESHNRTVLTASRARTGCTSVTTTRHPCRGRASRCKTAQAYPNTTNILRGGDVGGRSTPSMVLCRCRSIVERAWGRNRSPRWGT